MISGKLSGAIVAVIAPRLKDAVLGTAEQRSIDQAVARSLAELADEFPGFAQAAASLPLELYFGHSDVASLLVDSAFSGTEPDRDTISIKLAALGYDETTSPVDLSAAAVGFSQRLRSQIRLDADRKDSTLFNRFVLAQLDQVVDSRQAPARPSVAVLPYLPPLIFGRNQDAEEIRARLTRAAGAGGSATVTVIRGWPGVGKTTLTAAVAHDEAVWRLFPDGIMWTALGQAGSVKASLAHWCRQLDPAVDADTLSVSELSARLTGLLHGKRVLLIVDDAWDAEQAVPLLAGGSGAAVLLTTRSTDVAYRLATSGEDIYLLEVLGEADGLALLRRLAPEVVDAYPGESQELVAEVEGLPLALQVAGRMLAAEAHLGLGVSGLLADLREGARLLSASAPADRADLASATTPTVAALLAQSTSRLPSALREQFAYLGAFAEKPASFSPDAISAVWGVTDPLPGIRVLVGRGLLEPIGMGRFQMHALLAMHAKALLNEL
jgi:NB-ARC domain